jgi:predicted MFS family arabinose efflux permease
MTVAVWTLGERLFMPTLTTMISLRASEENQGRYQSLLSVAFGLGFIAGPALGTRVYERFGGTVLWLGTAGLALAAAVVFLLLGRRPTGTAPEGDRSEE